ncbi:M20/M25/M40 family metallo-hydrolase [Massilia sp. TS11]|uniref:M20/M25/M40 family metallo-hydrolase n=1 Tax=Massilia sp. TS11 TaxID=2908003 RepID=UPI001EDB7B34|nr:M20/M25/M40 family metallo-hydrolase [Massilia sp. TS11]MCG2584533.1 M20/M25/M40 family metallo-hydrolase [Massilia sp. TS11]
MSRLALASLLAVLMAPAIAAPANDAATLNRVRDHAMQSDWAYQRLEDLTDLVGPRLSGSAGAAAAVEQVAATLRALGARVTLQPVKVPHWVRGEEKAELVEYVGRPAGLSQRVALTALGGSGATPAAGLTAALLVLNNFDELEARKAEVKGRIVLFNVPFDQWQAERGLAGPAYGHGAGYRFMGPRRAAELGAAAALVRSVGGADFRLPHTGATGLAPEQRIPAAAVSTEDALLMARLARRGPLAMHLTLTPQTLPDADSFNVIADWPGTDKADEVVLVSGHLDSWDLGTGAHDDGTGIAGALGVLHTLRELGLHGRRTIRMVAWMNEENGGRGAQAYQTAFGAQMGKHVGAIESDGGGGHPFGLMASVSARAEKLFKPLQAALQPIGAGVFRREERLQTGDLHLMEDAGVPSFEPLIDTSTYFHYHHTAADTFDKVSPDALRRHVAVMASLAWFMANMDETPGRVPALAD